MAWNKQLVSTSFFLFPTLQISSPACDKSYQNEAKIFVPRCQGESADPNSWRRTKLNSYRSSPKSCLMLSVRCALPTSMTSHP